MPAAVLNPSTHQDESAEAKAAFHLRLRARGVRDLAVLRAFETVPRDRFVPERYTAMAARDQTTHEPWLLARAVEALAVEPGHRVLEVGSGSGYVTAVMAQLAGEVLGLERWASLAEAAQARLDALEAENATVVWADGLAMPSAIGCFDRILVHAELREPTKLIEFLSPHGRFVAGRCGELVVLDGAGGSRSLGPCPYAFLVAGLAGRRRVTPAG